MAESTKNRIISRNCPNCGAALPEDVTACIYCGSLVAVAICPSCFGAVSVGMKHCPACGAEATSAPKREKTSLHCPRCESEMSQVAMRKYSLHQCLKCGGLWLDHASFRDICMRSEEQEAVLGYQIKSESVTLPKKRKARRCYIPCPECGKLMNHKNFSHCSGIVLDYCRDHGSWFDKSELQQVVTFIMNGGLKKAREREKADLQYEKQRLRMQKFNLAVNANHADTHSLGALDFNPDNDSFLEALSRLIFR
jgi:Zn-finger nucleic acid-binding protein